MLSIMQHILIRKKAVVAVAAAGTALFIGFALVANPMSAAALALLPLIVYMFSADKKTLLFFFILMSPYAYTPLFSQNIMDITGAKPFNLVAALCFAGIFFHGAGLLPEDKTEKKILFYFFLYFMIFTIASLRTLEYLPLLHKLRPEEFHGSPLRHLLSTYVQPALYFIPFLFIIKHIKTYEDISRTARAICLSCFVLSVIVLMFSLPNIAMIVQSRKGTKAIFNAYLGMHYNAVGSLYLSTYPILLHQAFKKHPFDIINLVLAVIVVGILQSRSAILVVLIATYLYLFLAGRRIHILWLTSVLVCFALAWLPFFLLRTLQTGIEEGDLNAIFTNRIDMIWKPLITEWIGNKSLLLFGKGRYGMMTSAAYQTGFLVEATHAHNAYIDFFLNCGIILLMLLVGFIIRSMKYAWGMGRKINDGLYWALFLCILSFLIGAFTQRDFLPKHENLFLFPVTALLINYTLLWKRAKQ